MAAQESMASFPVSPEEVARQRPPARWSVEESGWKEVLPGLPDEVIALLATPVVVSAESLAVRPRSESTPAPRVRTRQGDPSLTFLAPPVQEPRGARHNAYVS